MSGSRGNLAHPAGEGSVPGSVVRPLLVLLLAAVILPGCRRGDPSLPGLATRAEATDYRETTRYGEVVAFMEAAAAADPGIRLTTSGYTFEGRPLPLAVVGDVADASPEAVRAAGGVRVYLQGNIHAGEVCGKEALLALLREIAEGRHPRWRDTLVLLVAPIYNADGNERIALDHRRLQHGPIGGMGQRANAMGLDLNRDHTKLASPEARSFADLLTRYDPHVTVDLHTTNGTRHGYHLTYSPPYHPATEPGVVELLRGELLPAATRGMAEEGGWEAYYYGNVYPPEEGAEPGWVTFDHRPRYNNNYVGLRNRLAILSEAYAYATFRDRVAATRRFVEEILDFSARRTDAILRTVRAADGARVVGDSLPLRAELERSGERVEILMGAVEEERHPYTGRPILRRTDSTRIGEMYEWGSFRGTERERVPAAYLLPQGTDDVVERLRAHGIDVRRLSEPRSLPVERFRIESTRVAERAFQGVRQRSVRGAWGPAGVEEVPRGTAVVPMDRPLARLAFILLEPRSDDGFLNWGLLDRWLEEEGRYPVLRTHRVVSFPEGDAGEEPGGGG